MSPVKRAVAAVLMFTPAGAAVVVKAVVTVFSASKESGVIE
jgi:hypothetical protein